MHELSLCQSVVRSIEAAAGPHGFSRVRRVRLAIGAFAGVEPDAMRFGFDVATQGTLAEGATLEILEMPGTAWCFDCNDTVTLAQRFDACPRCAGFRLRLTGGEELRIQDLEVD